MKWFLCICIVFFLGITAFADSEVAQKTRTAIDRSVPYIESAGNTWITTKQCVSCHRVNTMVWSLGASRAAGARVGEEAEETLRWAIDVSLKANDEGQPAVNGNKEGVAQLLIAQLDHFQNISSIDIRAAFRQALLHDLDEQARWPAGGQLPSQKRTQKETTEVSTYWLSLAASRLGCLDLFPTVLRRLREPLPADLNARSTEWYAVRLLLANSLQDHASARRLRADLFEYQQGDGGWGWLINEESDALGTGLALYALLVSGSMPAEKPVRTARAFLLSSQQGDGSWVVKGTKAKKQELIQETAGYWGTCWATIALSECLLRDEVQQTQ